ncbi:MAG TPA: TonB-dependent receptor [Terriglobales bacterium]|nr:TonB-dependent receptor [Terriglobales bacterium]
MKRFSTLLWSLLILAVLSCSTYQVFAQGIENAQLNGTISDPSGRVVAGAAIRVRNTATDFTYTATSNESGFYAIANMRPGTYELKASASGFANYTQKEIVLTVGQVATINVNFQVAAQGETIVVTTEAPVIEPTRSEISQVVATQQVQALPTSSRVFTDFALLTPGVATSRTSLGTTFTEFEVTQISFAGMRSFSNEITVDGADFVNAASGIQRATPSQEAVQEFRVVNNSFGAEYGRAVGGIVNIVTKSGTNDLHGSLYEYFQNSATDARSLLQPAPLPHFLRQNQFGGSLGGPIVKNKTFFFLNYEAKRSAQSPIYPPDLVNNVQLIDQAKALMGLAPEGCSAALNTCLPGFAGDPANISQAQAFSFLQGYLKTGNEDFGFARIDHQITTNNRLGIRYNVEDIRALGELVGNTLDGGGIGVPSGGRNLYVRDQSLVATVDSVLSSNVVNTVLAQYARRHYGFFGATGQPDFSVLNDLELGHNFGTNDRLFETRGQLSESVSWTKGRHIMKFGFDGNYLSSLETYPGFTPVRLLIPGISCLSNFAEFFNGLPGSGAYPTAGTGLDASSAACPVAGDNGVVFTYAGVPLPTDPDVCAAPLPNLPCSPTVTSANPLNGGGFPNSSWAEAYPSQFIDRYNRLLAHGYWGGFAQDQWRVTPNFTFNFGLRWDVESGLAQYVNTDYNGFQPRLGLAYSPNPKTVIRAGFGMFFDRQNLTFFFVPNTQKIVNGYQCGNHANSTISSICSEVGITPQVFPNIMSNLAQASQGYQLFGFPASQNAAGLAANIIQTGSYSADFPAGISMAGTCFTTGACGVGEGGMDHNARTPYAEQASFEINRQFGRGFALNLSYLFVEAHKLVRGNNINIPCPVGTTKSGPPTDPLPEWVPGWLNADGTLSPCDGTPTLGYGAVAGLGPFFGGALGSGLRTLSGGLEDYNNGVANAVYHGGTITAIERIKYFNMTANYTYSHAIDNGNFTTFINLPPDQFDYAAERSNSNQDVRHRFVMNFTATAPERGPWRNFQLSSIITLQSGRPFTLFYGNNTLNDIAGGATDRVGGAPAHQNCPSVQDCQTMIPRNTYIGDPDYNIDLRIARTVHINERVQMNLAFDAFNLLNRPNVDEITSVYGSPVFCGSTPTIPRHYNDGVSRAIQEQSGGTACPVSDNGLAIPGVGSFARTPITDTLGASCYPSETGGPSTSCLFIPALPNANFGLPRTMLNARQLQFSLRFTF